MSQITKKYLAGFDELNIVLASALLESENAEQFVESIGDFLISTYASGYRATDDDIDEIHEIDTARLFDVVELRIDGKNYKDRLLEYYEQGAVEDIKRVVETDYHRIYNTAVLDTAKQSDKSLYKIWRTLGDEKVRDSHFYLEGQKLRLDEDFITIYGNSAKAPGQFGVAEEDCNCRCSMEITDR